MTVPRVLNCPVRIETNFEQEGIFDLRHAEPRRNAP
jgi:hypothetical protein